jgi:putative NADH-flavin reductase
MNILIVGTNGKNGLVLVQQASELGHVVTAVVHHEPKPTMQGVRILQGDVRDPQFIESAIVGQQAIINTIGTRQPFLKTTLETDAARRLIDTMCCHRIRRIVAVSSTGVGDSIAYVRGLYRALMPGFPRAIPDREGMEAQIRNTDLDWTIVRPAGFTDGLQTNAAQIVTPDLHRRVRRIARADVAAFILNHIADVNVYRAVVGLTTQVCVKRSF